MILLDAKNDEMRVSGTFEDLKAEMICIIKIIQQEFISRNENDKFIGDIIEALFDEELTHYTKEYIKENKESGDFNVKSRKIKS